MRLASSICLLLTIAIKLIAADRIPNCATNNYKNDPSLLSKLNGYLYTVSTSVGFGSNEIFKFDPIVEGQIHVRTTTDNSCCRTMNVDTVAKRRHLEYEITNDKNCPTQLSEHAHMKLLTANNDADGSYCILLWTCRKSREGVHAFCTTSKVSDRQKKWIYT